MKQSYSISVDDQHTFELSAADLKELDVHRVSPTTLHVLYRGESFLLEVKEAQFHQKKYQIQRGSTPHDIQIANPLDALISSLGFSLDSKNDIQQITAPMPGLILDIHVKAGQEVQENDPLLILEAMKMENVVASPRGGIIKEVHISQGTAVEKSQLLIEFEND